ncbi:Protein of unknown function [Gryllus bimaculatus]|nr:Protein of unknown function [Gryllus bimaculatus]
MIEYTELSPGLLPVGNDDGYKLSDTWRPKYRSSRFVSSKLGKHRCTPKQVLTAPEAAFPSLFVQAGDASAATSPGRFISARDSNRGEPTP